MPRPIRIYESPNSIYFVTNRCLEARYLLVPTEKVNTIVLGCLARAVQRHEIDLFAFVFMSNHFHLLVRAPDNNLNKFMCFFQGLLARKLNLEHGREGKFFHRRYSAEPVLDSESVLGRYCYIAGNPCLSNLVSCPKDWPGQSSHKYLLSGRAITGKWIDRTLLAKMRRKRRWVEEKEAEKQFTFSLAPLPGFENLGDSRAVEKLDHAVCRYLKQASRQGGKRKVLGVERILALKHTQRPEYPKKSPRPPCHCRCPKIRAEFLQRRRDITRAHRTAMQRAMHMSHSLPLGTFAPGRHRPERAPCRFQLVATG